jgi:hypothetical protein
MRAGTVSTVAAASGTNMIARTALAAHEETILASKTALKKVVTVKSVPEMTVGMMKSGLLFGAQGMKSKSSTGLTVRSDPASVTTVPTGGTSIPNSGTTGLTNGTTVQTGETTVPKSGTLVTTGGLTVPTGGTTAPTGGTSVPTNGRTIPTGGTTVPIKRTTTLTGGTAVPINGTTTPIGRMTVPIGRTTAAFKGMTTPTGGMTVPTGGTMVRTGGTTTPSAGMTIRTGDTIIRTGVTTSLTTEGTFVTAKAPNGTLATTNGTSVTAKPTSGTIQEMSGTIQATSGTFGTTAGTSGLIRSSGTTVGLSGTKAFSPIIRYIIMLCGFESDGVFVEYIKQQEWSELIHVTLMSMNDINEIHTVENNGFTFKARPLERDLQVLKGFLMYHKRMSRKLNRSLDDNDVMTVISKSMFECYRCSEYYQIDIAASGSFGITSFDEMVAAGVFHVESEPPSVLPKVVHTIPSPCSMDDGDDKDEANENTLFDCTSSYNADPTDTLFVDSWYDTIDDEEIESLFEEEEEDDEVVTFDTPCNEHVEDIEFADPSDRVIADTELFDASSYNRTEDIVLGNSTDRTLNETEAYKGLFKEDDDTIAPLKRSSKSNCTDEAQEACTFKTETEDERISSWGANEKVNRSSRWGATYLQAFSGTKNGEKMFVVYNQRMLIVVFDKTVVFDPGGIPREKELQRNLLVQE